MHGQQNIKKVQVMLVVQTAPYLTEEKFCQFTQQGTSLQDIQNPQELCLITSQLSHCIYIII